MSQFKEFWIDDVNSYIYRNGINRCANEIHVIEIAALEDAQKEIEKLTAALKVAEDAFEHIIEVQSFLGGSSVLQQDCEQALAQIQKIKKELE